MVANMIVVLDKKSTEEFEQSSDLKVETEDFVRTALRGAIASGQVGGIRVDPSYLKFETTLGTFTKHIASSDGNVNKCLRTVPQQQMLTH